jgi:hypothetical protein
MKRLRIALAIVASLVLLASSASAQDYRGRVQGLVQDTSSGALPGVTVTLTNDATAAPVARVTDTRGRYVFDFVSPGVYTITAELQGFKKAEQKNVRVAQRGDVTADLSLAVGGLEETVVVEAPPVSVQFNTSSSDLTLERQLIDQVPISGRNPYNLSTLDPTLTLNAGNPNENRPYHHAYANEYDAGGGTRRANDVLLDGVPLGASFKTAYTPNMDAVEEVTVSKNSVDAENGHSLGGIISLNMKAGTNAPRGSAYYNMRDPGMNSISDPTLRRVEGADETALKGTQLKMGGGTFGGAIKKNKIFSFSSFEQWDDNRPLSIVRTVPTELERRGDFSQSVLSGRIRTIYDPYSSTLDSAGRVVRNAFANNQIPTSRLDPVALRMLTEMPLPNLGGNIDNWQGSVYENTNYWNVSERVDINITDNWKVFARYGQFKANLYQQNPTDAGFLPLSGSNRYGMSTAADSVWVMSNKTTLNVRGSFYNMTDEFYNPDLLLGADGLNQLWPNNPWYKSLYNSGYVYYPALDVTSGTGTATTNRLGRQGREHFQHPDAWTVSARMNRYEGRHDLKWGGEMRSSYGEAARFEPINLVFNSALTANSSDAPDVTATGNQWASFMLGALDGQTSARLVPLQNPDLKGYAAYVQDDIHLTDNLSLNVGLRWEWEPGPTDPSNRLSQRIDLSSPIPEMQGAGAPAMPAQASQLMASKGLNYIYNGAWLFTSKEQPNAWHTTPWNFLPRFGASYKVSDKSVARFAYARYLMPTSNVRDTLGDFVEQYAGYQQFTPTLGLTNGVPRQTLNDPYPTTVNPVTEPYAQLYGRYTNLGAAANLDEYELRPQVNDRFSISYQREMWKGTIVEAQYFYNLGTRLPYDKNLNMMDPSFRYEQKAVINTQVANPFRNYLTADKFPGALRNTATVALSTLLVPYPQYTQLIQRNTNGKMMKTQTFELRGQRPFVKGTSVMLAYAYNKESRQEWFDEIAQYKVFQTGEGFEWRPTNSPVHRVTGAVTWQVPVGRDRRYGANMPAALDAVVGGWQTAASIRWYSGRLLLFGTSYVVDGNPKIDNPTNDRWFDTTKFHVQDAFAPRSNAWYYDGLNGPSSGVTDLNVTKNFRFGQKYRMEFRLEAYNVFNNIIWEDPDLNIASANFGKVTRKRLESSGREMQVGLRFLF